MKELSDEDRATKAHLVERITRAEKNLAVVVDKFNTIIEGQTMEIGNATADLNDAIAEADAFREGIAHKQQMFANSQTGQWTFSDEGEKYHDWMNSWAEELMATDTLTPEMIEPTNGDVAESFDSLPDKP
jgi:hypothetical protein